jgi:hypothetical protein
MLRDAIDLPIERFEDDLVVQPRRRNLQEAERAAESMRGTKESLDRAGDAWTKRGIRGVWFRHGLSSRGLAPGSGAGPSS